MHFSEVTKSRKNTTVSLVLLSFKSRNVYDFWSGLDFSRCELYNGIVDDKIEYFKERYGTSSEKQSEIAAKVTCTKHTLNVSLLVSRHT